MKYEKLFSGSNKEEVNAGTESANGAWHLKRFDRNVKKIMKEESLLLAIPRNHPLPDIQLRFYFIKSESVGNDWKKYETREYLSLAAKIESAEQTELSFKVTVKGGSKSEGGTFTIGSLKPTPIIEYFFYLADCKYSKNFEKCKSRHTSFNSRPKSLRLEISATPQDAATLKMRASASNTATCISMEDHVLSKAMERMFLTSDNFPDVLLETEDMMTLPAHRFILAARSPYFANLFANGANLRGSDGKVTIECNSQKPLAILVKWMYTGKIAGDMAYLAKGVIQLAVQFEMPELLKALDNSLIKFCNRENMFQLCQVAEQNQMNKAVADIVDFITKNTGAARDTTEQDVSTHCTK